MSAQDLEQRARTLLAQIRHLLASLPVDCLGSDTDASGQPYPIRDEVIHGITKLLAHQPAPVVDDAMREGCVGAMTPARASYFLRRFKTDEKMLGPHEQWALDFAITALGQQPAPVVDDAMVERALNAKVGHLSVRQLFACEREARQGALAILTAADDRALNAGRLKALHRGLELARKWSAGTGTHGYTDHMVRDMADELRSALSSQDGDYAHQPAPVVDDAVVERMAVWIAHLEAFVGPSAIPTLRASLAEGRSPGGAALGQQPAPVVDDAMVDAAIAAQDAHWANDANYPARAPRSVKGNAALHDKLARGAMRAALTAALARTQEVQS